MTAQGGSTVFKMSDIGPGGLVVFNGTTFQFVKEDTWRRYKIKAPSAALSRLADGATVTAPLPNKRTFVNLQMLAQLQKERGYQAGPSADGTEDGAEIVVHADNGFYSVRAADLKDIPPGFEGDAGVLVSRGAVVATVPQNVIQTGSWCVLINTASVVAR